MSRLLLEEVLWKVLLLGNKRAHFCLRMILHFQVEYLHSSPFDKRSVQAMIAICLSLNFSTTTSIVGDTSSSIEENW